MKYLKKSISLLLCVMLLCTMVPMTALSAGAVSIEEDAEVGATSGSFGDGLSWYLNTSNKSLTISGSGAMPDWNSASEVPWAGNTINYVNIGNGITRIGNYSFSRFDSVYSITLGNAVTEIGDYAFYRSAVNTNSLSMITFPDSVTSIGKSAFENNNYWQITFGSGLLSIGERAFYNCMKGSSSTYEGVTIPDSVVTIGESAFENCAKMPSITLGSGVESIGKNAFNGCSTITELTIPSKVKTINRIGSCSALKTINLSNTVERIEEDAFSGCSGAKINFAYNTTLKYVGSHAFGNNWSYTTVSASYLKIIGEGECIGNEAFLNTQFSLSGGLTIGGENVSIGDGAFYCSKLSSVTLQNGIAGIGAYAFRKTNITSLTIPNSVTEIGTQLCYECSSLQSVTVGSGVTEIPEEAFNSCSSLSNLTIGSNVTTIGKDAFRFCRALTNVSIPNSVTSIGGTAFSDCSGITTLSFGSGLKSIGNSAFSSCGSLTSVSFPYGLQSIGSGAFSGCTNLASVSSVPDSVTYIGSFAFGDQDYSRTSYITNESNWTNGMLYSGKWLLKAKNTVVNATVRAGTIGIAGSAFTTYSSSQTPALQSISIPNSVKSICDSVFYRCSGLTEITIPSGVTLIGASAFNCCTGLTQLTLPSGLETINQSTFYGCTALTTINIPNGVDKIDENAFKDCTSLSGITIPGSVKSIEYQAFYNCGAKSVVLQEGVQKIAQNAFQNCEMETLSLPNSLTSLGDGYSTFESCNKLKELTIPDGITSVPQYCFRYCSSLEKVNLGKNMESLGYGSFYGCSKMKSIVIPITLTWVSYSADSSCNSLKDIFYEGGSSDWSKISFDRNYNLTGGRRHYNTTDPDTHVHTNLCTAKCSCDCNTSWASGWDSGETPLGHNVQNWTVTKAATCTEDGSRTGVCTRCGDTIVETIDALGHDWEWTVTKEATCTEDGEETRTCSRCHESETRAIEKLGHNLVEITRDEATCEEEGEITYRCSRCRKYFYEDIPALGHDYGDWTTTKEATCTENGEEKHTCSRCDHFETRVVDALGHDYQTVVTPATCTEGGYTTHTCSRCHDSYVTDRIEALGHDYGEWTTTKEATCTEAGEEKHTCSRCDHSETRVVDALGHDYGEWTTTKEAACTEDGEEKHTCSRCDHFETRVVEALGHDYDSVVTPPTCTGGGYTTHTCSRCQDSYIDSEVNPLGHDYMIEITREPTAKKTGGMSITCSRCDFDEYVVLPKLNENDYTISNNTATCTEAGTATYTWKTTTYGTVSFEVEVPALGHDYLLTPINAQQHKHICSRCNAVDGEPEAHSYTDGVCACGYEESGFVNDPNLKALQHTISLRSDLSINYYIPEELFNQYTDMYMIGKKAIYDKDGNITDYEDQRLVYSRTQEYEGKTYYGFSFTGVNAKEFSSIVSATFYGTKNGLLHKGETTTYSVKQYAMEQLAATNDENLKKLLVDLLNYGTAAQTFFQSNLIHPANEDLTADQKVVGTVTAEMINMPYDKTLNTLVSGIKFSSVTLSLRSEISLSLYLQSDKNLTFACDKDGVKYKNVEKQPVTVNGVEYQVARIRDIASNEIGNSFTLTVTDSDGTDNGSVTYSPMTYCYNVLDRGTTEENLPEVVQALYWYWQSAKTYFV